MFSIQRSVKQIKKKGLLYDVDFKKQLEDLILMYMPELFSMMFNIRRLSHLRVPRGAGQRRKEKSNSSDVSSPLRVTAAAHSSLPASTTSHAIVSR